MGDTVVDHVLDRVESGIASSRTRLSSITETSVAEHARRMLSEAADLNARAKALRTRGDNIGALDLASHAAGLVNALQHLVAQR
jgi:hypothetical protein